MMVAIRLVGFNETRWWKKLCIKHCARVQISELIFAYLFENRRIYIKNCVVKVERVVCVENIPDRL